MLKIFYVLCFNFQALIHGLNRHYYSISINYKKNELEQKVWILSLYLSQINITGIKLIANRWAWEGAKDKMSHNSYLAPAQTLWLLSDWLLLSHTLIGWLSHSTYSDLAFIEKCTLFAFWFVSCLMTQTLIGFFITCILIGLMYRFTDVAQSTQEDMDGWINFTRLWRPLFTEPEQS